MKLQQWLMVLVLSCALEEVAQAQDGGLGEGVPPPTLEAGMLPPTLDAGMPPPTLDAGMPPPTLDADTPPPRLDAGTLLAESAQVAYEAAVPPLPAPTPAYGARAQVERRAGPGEFDAYGTGSRLGIPLLELPHSVAKVERRTLTERGVVDLTQALGLVSGTMPTWQYGGFLHVRIRGFQAMTLIDGRRDPRALLAESAPQSGLYDIDRIEVLRGPSPRCTAMARWVVW
jgi:hypothetical protein